MQSLKFFTVFTVRASKGDNTYNDGAAKDFTELMIDLTARSTACEGLAILSFAIEMTVSSLYKFIWDGLKKSKILLENL